MEPRREVVGARKYRPLSRRARPPRRAAAISTAESEEHYVTILDDVVLAFGPREPLLPGTLPPADAHEIPVRHRFRADEALLEVGVDDARGGRRLVAAVDGPRADFLLAGREVALQPEQVICRMRQPVEPGFGQAERREEIGPVGRGQLRELGLDLGGEGDDLGLLAVAR